MDFRPSPYRFIRRVCQRPALHFVTSKEARSGTISTSDANDPMAIISMLFLFVKQSAFICRTFIKNGSGKGRNGCTKFLPRLSSYSPRHSPHAESGSVLLSQSGNRNSRAVRSFAIPAFISLNRPQGALDFGSKYNAAHWSG